MHTDASLVVAFLNTVDIERNEDLLDDPELWHRWTAEHNLTPGQPATPRAARDDGRATAAASHQPAAHATRDHARATPATSHTARDDARPTAVAPHQP
ncbi:MAG: hypothetical protein ACRD0H_02070, partial [Actinomycetes bacterium]